MRDPQSITVNDDERIIPVWSIIVASGAFVLVEYYFWMVAPEQRHHAPPPLGFRIYFNLSWGIVAALYFLLRQPQVTRCPACGTHVQSDFHFCPQCNYQLTANCGNCFRTVRATDQYCTRCGHELAKDQMPTRLHVLGD